MLVVWLKTIFSFTSYHLLRQAGAWRTAFFMLYLLLVGSLVFNIYFAWQVHEKLPVFIRNFPAITFEKGHLITSEQVSLAIPQTDQFILFTPSDAAVPTQDYLLDKHIAILVRDDYFYMPSVVGVSSQQIPAQIDGKIDTQTLQTYAPTIRNLLQSIFFVTSFFALGGFLLFSYFLAWAVCFFWCGLKHTRLPLRTLSRWAAFLQGPALALWIINLLCGVPLFLFAIFILFNMYVQQIFNTLPDNRGNYVA